MNLEQLILNRTLPLRELRLLIAIHRLADADGVCTATQAELGRLAGIRQGKVAARVRRLATAGLVQCERWHDGRRRRSRYKVVA